jgi:hypothetical protein
MTNRENALRFAYDDMDEAIRLAKIGDGRDAPIEYCKIKDKKGFLRFLFEFPVSKEGRFMADQHEYLFYFRDKHRVHTDPSTRQIIEDSPQEVINIDGKSTGMMCSAEVQDGSLRSVSDIQSYIP